MFCELFFLQKEINLGFKNKLHFYFRLSGLSPFMGENDNDTYANINRAIYDFDDESFTDISKEAKDFISKLLVKDKEYRKKINSF